MNLDEILLEMIERNGSDLHLKSGRPPLIRISGELLPTERDAPTSDEILEALSVVMNEETMEVFRTTKDADFSYEIAGKGRFRVNAFHQMSNVGAVFRYVPMEIPSIDDLNLPPVLKDLVMKKQGLILVTGPTGSGKSTTLAAMVRHINETLSAHIMTIEDPVEFVYEDQKATINQREVRRDTTDFNTALRAALRQDPDVILMGEMRDQETIEIAMHAAETGHLVFSTLHTNDSAQTIDRVMNTFPAEAQTHVREMLALVLCGIIAQRLVPKADDTGRVAAVEIMINSPNISELIEKGDTSHLEVAIAKSGSYYRMQTLNQALAPLVEDGIVTEEAALATSTNPDDLKLLLKGFSKGGGTTTVRKEAAKEAAKVTEENAEEEPKDEGEQGKEEDAEKTAGKLKITRGFKF